MPKEAHALLVSHPHAAMTLSVSSNPAETGSWSDTTADCAENASDDFDDDEFVCGADIPAQDDQSSEDERPSPPLADFNVSSDEDENAQAPLPSSKRKRRQSLPAFSAKHMLRAMAAVMGAFGEAVEAPADLLHDLPREQDVIENLTQPGTTTVSAAEVKKATGREAEAWRVATEKEYVENFVQRNVHRVATEADRKRHGPPLPMKLVYTRKTWGVCKVRAVVCGNFEKFDPTQALWTAQAEPSSLIAGLRLGLLRGWDFGTLDVSGAFMYAPLPETVHVLVQPPRAFVDAGLVKPGEVWVLQRAVYGLRVAPRAWGKERDRVFRDLTWEAEGVKYCLEQCAEDSQVWKIVRKGDPTVLGVLIVYVDDFMLGSPSGAMREAFKAALKQHWTMKDEVKLEEGVELTFLGLQLQRVAGGIKLHQGHFVDLLLEKHGMTEAKSLSTVAMKRLPEVEDPPEPDALRDLQAFAGEFNWLATRSRSDLSYFTSLLASALSKYGLWSLQLAKKILRYLKGTRDVGLFLPDVGDEATLVVWSDAGYAGIGTSKAQSGLFLMWAGPPLLWRSSRQTVPL